MWDDGYCDPVADGGGFDGGGFDGGFVGGYDYGCYDPDFIGYDYGPYYGPGVGFVAPIGGYYNQPYVVREQIVRQGQSQPQVVVVNNKGNKKKGKKVQEVEYMMVDPTDKEGKRLIKVDPQKVKEGAYVFDDRSVPVASKSSASTPNQSNVNVQQPAVQKQAQQGGMKRAPRQQARTMPKKKSRCGCC